MEMERKILVMHVVKNDVSVEKVFDLEKKAEAVEWAKENVNNYSEGVLSVERVLYDGNKAANQSEIIAVFKLDSDKAK